LKIALLTDTHWGARNDSPVFDAFFEKYYKEVFFPYLDEHNITTVVHLGDAFDKRKYINFQTLKNCKRYFFDKVNQRNIDLHIIAGNHDCFHKNTNDVNAIDLLLTEYPGIKTYSTLDYVEFDGTKILLMPWICSDNYDVSVNELKNAKTDIVFGHFEIAGFPMYKGTSNEHGFSSDLFDRFDIVYSGHFHHRSTNGNITYLGTSYEITWSDYDDLKGFHIFDTDTRKLTFVPNPNSMFVKYHYDDSFDQSDIDYEQFAGKYVKILIISKRDIAEFDKFMSRVHKQNPIDLKIIEDFSEFESDVVDDDNIDIEDTVNILSSYVDSIDTDADKDRIKATLKSLYLEALNQE
jgi:DNA repair exonuclease SbcCD nuclease subunit